MLIRRRVTLRAAVIEAEVAGDRRISAAALGLYTALAAAPAGAQPKAALLTRFGLGDVELDDLLAELRRAGHLDDVAQAVPPLPGERRRRPYRKPWLPSSCRLLLRMLSDRADAKGCVTTSNRMLAEVSGHTERSVKRNLMLLEEAGAIRRENGRRAVEGQVRLIWIRDSSLAGPPPEGTVR